jgi:hypothetical protein
MPFAPVLTIVLTRCLLTFAPSSVGPAVPVLPAASSV